MTLQRRQARSATWAAGGEMPLLRSLELHRIRIYEHVAASGARHDRLFQQPPRRVLSIAPVKNSVLSPARVSRGAWLSSFCLSPENLFCNSAHLLLLRSEHS
jgi:hypothetical protein